MTATTHPVQVGNNPTTGTNSMANVGSRSRWKPINKLVSNIATTSMISGKGGACRGICKPSAVTATSNASAIRQPDNRAGRHQRFTCRHQFFINAIRALDIAAAIPI